MRNLPNMFSRRQNPVVTFILLNIMHRNVNSFDQFAMILYGPESKVDPHRRVEYVRRILTRMQDKNLIYRAPQGYALTLSAVQWVLQANGTHERVRYELMQYCRLVKTVSLYRDILHELLEEQLETQEYYARSKVNERIHRWLKQGFQLFEVMQPDSGWWEWPPERVLADSLKDQPELTEGMAAYYLNVSLLVYRSMRLDFADGTPVRQVIERWTHTPFLERS